MPLVSVIMPSYNHERYVAESIENILNQSVRDFELIIIDDASRDSSKQIIERYQQRDDRIKTIFHTKNMGISRTINDGLDIAQGKLIAIANSDDLWDERKLEKQLKVLQNDDNLVVWSEGIVIDAYGKSTGQLLTRIFHAKKKTKSGYIFEELLQGNYVACQSLIVKRENINSIKFSEELKYLNDYLFVLDLAYRYKYYFIDEPLIKYRLHGENTIITKRAAMLRENIALGKHFLQEHGLKIARRTKAGIWSTLAYCYLELGPRKMFLYSSYQAFKNNPLDVQSLIGPIIKLTKSRLHTRLNQHEYIRKIVHYLRSRIHFLQIMYL